MTNRRSFLQGMASASGLSFLGGTGVLAALGAQANAADVSGYKAIVCVFLFGGQDCHDTVLPFDQASYDGYAALRPGLFADYAAQAGGSSRDRSRLLPLNPTNAAQFGGLQQSNRCRRRTASMYPVMVLFRNQRNGQKPGSQRTRLPL